MNDDDFGEMESADSLDDSFSDTSYSMSEIDPNPAGRKIIVKTPSYRRRPSTRDINQQSKDRVWTRGGMNRGGRTWGFNHNAPPTKWLAFAVTDENLSSDDQSSDSEQEEDHFICSEWKEDAPKLKTFLFNERPGMKINVPEKNDQVFLFGLMLTDDLVEDLVKKTSTYADKIINRNWPLCRRSAWNSWTEITIDEMRKFIGLIFSMGLISMPSYNKYWSKDLLFKNEHFPSVMLRERFESIMRFFNFGEKLLFENDWWSKLQMLLDYLNKVMLDVITPEKNLPIDESMMLWHGCLVFWQYIKKKCQVWNQILWALYAWWSCFNH